MDVGVPAEPRLVHLAGLDRTDEHDLPGGVGPGQGLERVDVQPGVVEAHHTQARSGDGDKIGGEGQFWVEGPVEDLHVGGVEHGVGVRVERQRASVAGSPRW